MKITANTLFKDNPIPKIPPDWFWLFQSWVLKQAVNPFSRRVRMFWLLLYTCQQNGGGWAGDTKALASHQLVRPFPDKGVLGSEDGEQDMLVLMPHGNWRWATFSQLAHQLTFCRRKTTVRTLPGFPIPLCKPPADFLMAEFLGNPAPTSPSASWQSCWFGQQPSGHPSPSLDTHPSEEEEGELTSDKELVQLAGHSLNFFARPFVEKPSANQWWYCAEFSSPQFETNIKLSDCIFVQCISESYIEESCFLPKCDRIPTQSSDMPTGPGIITHKSILNYWSWSIFAQTPSQNERCPYYVGLWVSVRGCKIANHVLVFILFELTFGILVSPSPYYLNLVKTYMDVFVSFENTWNDVVPLSERCRPKTRDDLNTACKFVEISFQAQYSFEVPRGQDVQLD